MPLRGTSQNLSLGLQMDNKKKDLFKEARTRRMGERRESHEAQQRSIDARSFNEAQDKDAEVESTISDAAMKSLESVGEALLNKAKTNEERAKILADLNNAVAAAADDGSVEFRGINIASDGSATYDDGKRKMGQKRDHKDKYAIPGPSDSGFQWQPPKLVDLGQTKNDDSAPPMGSEPRGKIGRYKVVAARQWSGDIMVPVGEETSADQGYEPTWDYVRMTADE